MKKFLSSILAICILIGIGKETTVFAKETNNQIKPYNVTNISNEIFENIPIYVTYLDTSSTTDIQNAAKEDSTQKVKNIELNRSLASDLNKVSKYYKTIHASNDQKLNILSNPIFSSTLNQAQEMITKGTTVKYLNIFLPKTSSLTSNNKYFSRSSNNDDPAWWEANCSSLGTYNGYKFLYLESAIGFESSEVTPGNLNEPLGGMQLLKKL